MTILDTLLKDSGLKYEDLNVSEKETLNTWMETLEKNVMSLEKVRGYITSMKEAVEQELTKSNLKSKQDTFLKARLRNYMLLEAFMSTPERAKQQVENAISSMVRKVR